MDLNIIANISEYHTDALTQWDTDQAINLSGKFTTAPAIHFANRKSDKALVIESNLYNGVITAKIPNSLLREPYDIVAYCYFYEADGSGKTRLIIHIPVTPRPQPDDYVFPGDEGVITLAKIEGKVLGRIGDVAREVAVERARMDRLLSGDESADPDGELADIRVDFEGKTHENAGTAVRSQIANVFGKNLKNGVSIAKNRAYDYDIIAIYDSPGYMLADGTVYAEEAAYHCKYTELVPCVPGDVFSYLGIGQFNAVSYIFYDGVDIVSTGQLYSADEVTPKLVTVPSGVTGVVFSSYARVDTDVILTVKHFLPSIYEQLENAERQIVAKSKFINEVLADIAEPITTEDISVEWVNDYYYARDGRIVPYDNIVMGKIKVEPGETYIISGGVWASVVLYAFTDNANQLIEGYPADTIIGEPTNETVSVVVPEKATYLYINDITAVKNNADMVNAVKVTSYKRVSAGANVLANKIYVAVGDSYTEGDFSGWADENGLTYKNSPVIYDSVRETYKTYPWWIAERNNMTLYNCGKCGSIVALDKDYVNGVDGVDINSREPFSLNRYKELPEKIDYMTFWFGINDAGHTILGTIDDTDNTTFYGAWNVVLPYLIEKYPLCKMGMIVTTGSNSAYRQAVRDIAYKWGIPYLDLTGDPNVPLMNNRDSSVGVCEEAVQLRKNAFMLDNGHFNVQGHEYESTFIENFLRSL